MTPGRYVLCDHHPRDNLRHPAGFGTAAYDPGVRAEPETHYRVSAEDFDAYLIPTHS